MNSFSGQGVGLSELVQAEEAGLDLNRLLFVKYLVMTRRLTDYPDEQRRRDEGRGPAVLVGDRR